LIFGTNEEYYQLYVILLFLIHFYFHVTPRYSNGEQEYKDE